MDNKRRMQIYTRILTRGKTADGFYRLTPAQRRRAEHKFRRARKRTLPG